MRIAIVTDWLTNQGGSERVIEALSSAFPEAPIYTSVFNIHALPQFADKQVITSHLQHWPLARTKHQLFPLHRARVFENFDFSEFDVVISAASAEAKGIITKPETLHIGYIYTPVRYYWSEHTRYLKHPGFGILNPIIKRVAPGQISKMRLWDFAAAQRPDIMLGISTSVVERINKYYRRPAHVLFPPVNLANFPINGGARAGYIVLSRLIPYKRIDLAIQACNKLGADLTVIGSGSELKNLQKLAGQKTKFVTDASDHEVAELLGKAKGFLFPGEEDFGITKLEAMAAGTPVIAYKGGGALDTISNGVTGIYFNEQSVESLVEAIKRFETMRFDLPKLRAHAEMFDTHVFVRKFQQLVERELPRHRERMINKSSLV
jgi:glycosyltransferase involved in cell wall biosynthesis